MKKIVISLFVSSCLFVFLFCTAPVAHAHVRGASPIAISLLPSHAPRTAITSLKRGSYGSYFFSPTYMACRVYVPCMTIANSTGRTVVLTDDAQNFVANLRPGGAYTTTFYTAGTYYFSDAQQNIRVPLTVYAYWG